MACDVIHDIFLCPCPVLGNDFDSICSLHEKWPLKQAIGGPIARLWLPLCHVASGITANTFLIRRFRSFPLVREGFEILCFFNRSAPRGYKLPPNSEFLVFPNSFFQSNGQPFELPEKPRCYLDFHAGVVLPESLYLVQLDLIPCHNVEIRRVKCVVGQA